MRIYKFHTIIIFSIFILLTSNCIPLSTSQKISQNYEKSTMIDEAHILYSPIWTTSTFLINSTGYVNHTWDSSYLPGVSVWWLGDGMILRTIRVGIGPGTGGTGGGVQKVKWDGTVVWDFRYNTNGVMSHHDTKTLPNGNVFLIAWETKTKNEAIAAGRNPNYINALGFWPDHIIEVEPTGPTSGNIVWEWHAWDHLIQDYDPSKDNYGVVKNHPELIDVNYVLTNSAQSDFMHTNSIDYNQELDQILISVLNYNEIWIIDHSTTTEEAKGHTGGNSGKGGDLLYRWGNPKAYDTGTKYNQKLFEQHDASWINEGYPGEGNILIFNNRPSKYFSSVDEIIPPINANGEYYRQAGKAYGPKEQTWIYTASPSTSFFSVNLGGAHRLPNGNTLITNGATGKIFEVTPQKEIVWQYNTGGQLFKAVYILPGDETPEFNTPNLDCSGSFSWNNIKPGSTVYGSFQVENIGDPGSLLNWTIDESSINWGTWSFNPDSGENLIPEDGLVTIQVSVVAPNEQQSEFTGYIKVENKNDSSDFELIPVSLITSKNTFSFQTFIHQFILKYIK